MKKVISSIVFVAAIIAGTSAFAQGTKNAGQDAATSEGDFIFDFGVGFGGGYYSNNSYNGYGNSNTSGGIPTLSVSLQKAFWDDITIGGEVAFNSYKEESINNNGNTNYQYTQSNTFVLAKGEYHFNRLIGLDPKFDLYAGAIIGLRFSGSKSEYIDNNNANNNYNNKNNNVNGELGAFGGFRYYFVKNMSVYGEVGWAITPARVGLAWKF